MQATGKSDFNTKCMLDCVWRSQYISAARSTLCDGDCCGTVWAEDDENSFGCGKSGAATEPDKGKVAE